jgi:hypothetical protein
VIQGDLFTQTLVEANVLIEALEHLRKTYRGWVLARHSTDAERELARLKVSTLDTLLARHLGQMQRLGSDLDEAGPPESA